jgi:hypothetical protein
MLTHRDVIGLLAVTAGLGAALGAAWWALAPSVVLKVVGTATFPAEFQPRGYIADDGIAALACILGGVVTMGVAALLARRCCGTAVGYPTLGWSLVAGVVGAIVLWWVGTRLGAVDVEAAVAAVGDGGQVEAPLRLRMPGVLVLWPLASAAAFTIASWIIWIVRPAPTDR